ncbi:MAG: TonB-dependent receptor [Rheinheimera sp.]|nr:TonB-dependent receptor [Rheinheimera sp.]
MHYQKTVLALLVSQLVAPLATAAQAATQKNTAQDAVETITVTGSRLVRSSGQMPTPTTIIDAALIEATGAKNIGDLMHQLPALAGGIGAVSASDSNGGNLDSAGLELANLRGLGAVRTLVLVNGRRHVAGSAGSASVDLAMIPTALVERIDIVTGGASAIYGADAVTGVVNFVLKKDFSGVALDASYGDTSKQDNKRKDLALTLGDNFLNDKLNLTGHLNLSRRDELLVTARPFANKGPSFIVDQAASSPGKEVRYLAEDVRFQALSEEGLIYLPNAHWLFGSDSIATHPAPTYADDPFGFGYDTFTIDRTDGHFRPFVAGKNCEVVPCDGGDGFRTKETNTLITPSDRALLSLSARYQQHDDLTLFADAKYGRSESAASGQASVFHDDNFGPLIALQLDNPFLPKELRSLMQQRQVGTAALAVVGMNNQVDTIRETMQFTVGAEGSIGDYGYEGFLQHGEVDASIDSRDVLNKKYYEALDAVTDANGKAVCRSGNSACVAFDPIFNRASQAAKDYAGVTLTEQQKITQSVAALSLNGDLLETDEGAIAFAAGVELRRESSVSTPDALAQVRDADGVGAGLVGSRTGPTRAQNSYLTPVDGDFTVKEAFGEVSIPLLSDATLVKSLDLELAARLSNHSITGTDTTYKSALNWQLTDSFRLRGTYSKAVRAPNIGELFAPDSIAGARITDPCHKTELTEGRSPANRQKNCAALGIAADFVSEASFGTRSIQTRGNMELKPEEAMTYTLGLVWQPLARLEFSADWWDIEIEDAITQFDGSDVLANCVDGASLDAQFCGMVDRRADKQINLVRVTNINASKFLANGVDLDLHYSTELWGGQLSAGLISTYLDTREFWQNPANLTPVTNDAGTFRYPHWRHNLRAMYSYGDISLGWNISHVGAATFDKVNTKDGYYPSSFNNTVAAYTKHQLQLNYQYNDATQIYLNGDNVTNAKPDFLPGVNGGTLLYDAVGPVYTAGIRVKF